jgi:hypothetical protein
MSHCCSVCKEPISEGINNYSTTKFGKPLCLKHQANAVPLKTYYCSDCKSAIEYGEYKFSLKHFDKPLCRDCQPEEEEKFSAPPQKFKGTYKIEIHPNKQKYL